MSKGIGYWRWLTRALIRAPSDPVFEIIVGAMSLCLCPGIAVIHAFEPFLHLSVWGVRVAAAAVAALSFLVMAHGAYREDC